MTMARFANRTCIYTLASLATIHYELWVSHAVLQPYASGVARTKLYLYRTMISVVKDRLKLAAENNVSSFVFGGAPGVTGGGLVGSIGPVRLQAMRTFRGELCWTVQCIWYSASKLLRCSRSWKNRVVGHERIYLCGRNVEGTVQNRPFRIRKFLTMGDNHSLFIFLESTIEA